MSLSIIIVTFNSGKYIETCIRSILANSGISRYEIIIVDNCSSDNTLDLVNSIIEDGRILIIENSSNIGYSAAINRAVKKASFDNLLLLNPDVVLKNNAIHELLEVLKIDNIGVVGAKLISTKGDYQRSSKRHFPTLGIFISYLLKLDKVFPKSRIFGKYNYTFEKEDKMLEVDSVSGACMSFKKDVYSLVNGFDDIFFMYFEDTDFCRKVKDANMKVVYCPTSEVTHNNDYSDNYSEKMSHFFDSLNKFMYKYKKNIRFGFIIYFFSILISHLSYLKRIIYFNYNYKKNYE